MKQLVLTVIGEDKLGLVETLSERITSHQANWLASNLSYLAGFFAGIVQIEIAEEHLSALTASLAEFSGLKISVHYVNSTHSAAPDMLLRFVITGNDRPGIVHELSSVIRHKGANIIEFKSARQSAPNWGLPIFAAEATVQLNSNINRQEVINALESLANDIIVDVEMA